MADLPRPVLSIVTPAYNEAENLPVLYRRLQDVLAARGVTWEWVVVDDHSHDRTFAVLGELADRDSRVYGLRLARNSGSHTAIKCGLHQARGEAAVVMAADLQDPPELIGRLLDEWRNGAQVVWAARRGGRSESRFSRLYYWIMRRVVGLTDMPAAGADYFLVDAIVLEAYRRFRERNVSVLALITWIGYRQATITYEKQVRRHGSSGWSLEKKIKLLVDSITSFSFLPLRLISAAGMLVLFAGLTVLALALIRIFLAAETTGWLALIGVILSVAGLQLLALGVVGEYVWRALDESRGRPAYLIEASTSALTPPVLESTVR